MSLPPSAAARKDPALEPETNAQRSRPNTALTFVPVRCGGGPHQNPGGPCHRASRRSRADLHSEARGSKGGCNRAQTVNLRIIQSLIKVI
jgi:hypothetical protein